MSENKISRRDFDIFARTILQFSRGANNILVVEFRKKRGLIKSKTLDFKNRISLEV